MYAQQRQIIQHPTAQPNVYIYQQTRSPSIQELEREARSAFALNDSRVQSVERFHNPMTGETIALKCKTDLPFEPEKKLSRLDKIKGEIGIRRGKCTKYVDNWGTIYVWKKDLPPKPKFSLKNILSILKRIK